MGRKQWFTDEPVADLSQKGRRYSICCPTRAFSFVRAGCGAVPKATQILLCQVQAVPLAPGEYRKLILHSSTKEREKKLSAKYSAKMQTIFKAFPATAAPAITALTSLGPEDPERVSMGADIPLGLSHGRPEGCGRRGLKKSLKSLFLLFPPPNTARIPAPADVADNSLALAAAQNATAFYFHLKLA